MEQKVETEVVRRVWTEGCFIEVGDYEVPDLIELRTVGDKNVEWFGRLSVSMTPEFAEQLGRALMAAAFDKTGDKS